MILLILGLIVFFVGLGLRRGDDKLKHFSNPVRVVGFILILLGISTACVVQVEAGQVAVQKLFGKVQKEVLNSGLHFINPLVDVVKLDVKTQNYTMSGIQDEGHKTGDDAIRVLPPRPRRPQKTPAVVATNTIRQQQPTRSAIKS